MMQMKQITHSVSVPPLTDVQELCGQYHSLFQALGIEVANMFAFATGGFTHPIPESLTKLTAEYFNTKLIMSDVVLGKKGVKLLNTRVQNTRITFVFEYQG